MKKVNLKFVVFLFSAIVFLGCKDDKNLPSFCIDDPCGTVVEGATNVTVLNLEKLNVTAMGISVDGETKEISTDGWDFTDDVLTTCWTTAPNITSDSSVIFEFVVDGESNIIFMNPDISNDGKLVITLTADGAALQPFEKCIDIY